MQSGLASKRSKRNLTKQPRSYPRIAKGCKQGAPTHRQIKIPLTKNLVMKTIHCDNCKKENDPDNFICEFCGYDFDFQLTYNKWGLPELTKKIK